jgi:hypothetical protein
LLQPDVEENPIVIDDPKSSWRGRLRGSRWLIGLEMALVAGVFIADAYHHIYLSKTPYLIALGWISLSIRGQRWRAVGLSIPANWQRLLSPADATCSRRSLRTELLILSIHSSYILVTTPAYIDASTERQNTRYPRRIDSRRAVGPVRSA